MFSRELLPIYLNDHLAGATLGRELARRAAGANRDTDFGDFLTDLAGQIDADRESLLRVMAALEVGRDELKVSAGWLAEKAGRLKLNGRLTSYSALSRVLELESLTLGVRGKLAGWRTLASAQPEEPRLDEFDFVYLIARAEEQLTGLDAQHALAVELMLAEDAR